MSSQTPIKRLGMLAVFILCALITAFNGILGARTTDVLAIIVSVISTLALITFCVTAAMLAILRGDKNPQIVSLSLAAYAGINGLWIFIKACEAIAHGYFSIDHIFSLAFYAILLVFALQFILPFLQGILESRIIKIVAIACIWLIPIFQMFILPLVTAQGGIAGKVGGQILITLVEWLLQSIAFTWFMKE